ncbi:MAG: VacJ family lipoprotein [Desulfobacter sp.]|nr:VacJ family lipoprotein [Desulfobacter sp.]WDP86023.1 MAG: VacJ family lipoprotein [Desulfobacter sp.]
MKHLPTLILACLIILVHGAYALAEENPVPPPQTMSSQTGTDPVVLSEDSLDDEEFSDDLFDEYDTDTTDDQMVSDPIYYFNYAMYQFNDFLYFYGLKPVSRGYKAIVPTPARRGINNFFNNLLFPVRFVNNLLQGKVEGAATEFSAFFVNSTLGIFGFNDFAQKHMDITLNEEDLGQTLGSYNIGDGFYLVLPVLGPSTLRDTIGRAGDWFITPVNYVEPWELSWGVWGVDKTNRTSFRIGDYEALKQAALDPYVALRNAYIQNRRSLIRQ